MSRLEGDRNIEDNSDVKKTSTAETGGETSDATKKAAKSEVGQTGFSDSNTSPLKSRLEQASKDGNSRLGEGGSGEINESKAVEPKDRQAAIDSLHQQEQNSSEKPKPKPSGEGTGEGKEENQRPRNLFPPNQNER